MNGQDAIISCLSITMKKHIKLLDLDLIHSYVVVYYKVISSLTLVYNITCQL